VSATNVELVRRFYELLSAGDFDACSELLAPEFELVQPLLPDGGSYHGLSGFQRWAQGLVDAWEEIRWEPEQFLDGGEFVVVPIRIVTRGVHTSIEQVAHRFQVIRVSGTRIAFATGYEQLEPALAAAGLSE
jgi:ketosteroid isomerase-like protein